MTERRFTQGADPHHIAQLEVPGPCQLWLIHLDARDSAQGFSAPLALSADEVARAARFIFAKDRTRYVNARVALRQVLALRTGEDAASLRFEYGPHGKPRLRDHAGFGFNLSHSQSIGLIAIVDDGSVGVDVEVMRPVPDARTLAHQHFLSDECAALDALESSDVDAAFLRGWTRKEACLKAVGIGLAAPQLPPTGLGLDTRTLQLSSESNDVEIHLQSFELTSPRAIVSVAVVVSQAATNGTINPSLCGVQA